MDEFEIIVREVMDTLPEEFAKQLDNVAITVEERPNNQDLENAGVHGYSLLFGLYRGVPKIQRNSYYSSIPDKITIFRDPILTVSSNLEEAKTKIRRTVLHEIGHHFGMSETEIRKAMGE